jgi:hypothetical protein
MTRAEINQFIDYDAIFDALFKSEETALIESQYEAPHYARVLEFNRQRSEFELELEECTISDHRVEFVYIRSLNDANESNSQPSHESYYIEYDFSLEEFSQCDYEGP